MAATLSTRYPKYPKPGWTDAKRTCDRSTLVDAFVWNGEKLTVQWCNRAETTHTAPADVLDEFRKRATAMLADARSRSYNRDLFGESEADVVVRRLEGLPVDLLRRVVEDVDFEWCGSRPKTLRAVHDVLDAGWRAWRRIQA